VDALVFLGEVKSTWGAVSVLSADPFPQAASRTRRAPLEAPGAPQAPWWRRDDRQPVIDYGEGIALPR